MEAAFVYMYIAVEYLIIERDRVWIPLTVLNPLYCCSCPRSVPGFPPANVVVSFVGSMI
jgi:hypothetical protein